MTNYEEWMLVCETYAKRIGAELLSWDIDSNGALYMNIELEGE